MFTGKISWPLNFFPGIKNLIHWLVFLSVRFFQLSKNNSKLKKFDHSEAAAAAAWDLNFEKFLTDFFLFCFGWAKFLSLSNFLWEKKQFLLNLKKSKNHLTVEKIFRKKHIIVSRREIDGARWPDWKSIYHPIIDLLLSRNFKQTRNESQLLKAAAEKVWVNRKSIKFFKIRTCFGAAAARLKW